MKSNACSSFTLLSLLPRVSFTILILCVPLLSTAGPAVVSVARAMPSPTMADSLDYAVTFSDAVTGVDSPGNFTLATNGISGASIAAITGSGSAWTVTVNTGRGTGTLRLDVAAGGSIVDLSANPLQGTPFAGETYQVDKGGTVIGTGQGLPNPAFGVNGYALFSVEQTPTTPFVKVMDDGRIVAAGVDCDFNNGLCKLRVARYSAAGNPDVTFNDNAQAFRTSFPSFNAGQELAGLAINADGSVLVGGLGDGLYVAKFKSDGTLDTGFGFNGLTTINQAIGFAPAGMAVDGSERPVFASTTPFAQGHQDIFVVRLTTSGQLDGFFGSGGITTYRISSTFSFRDRGTDVAVQPDGKIVVGGRSIGTSGFFDFLVFRIDSNGTLDPTFGTGGVATTRFAGTGTDLGRKLVLQADGKIVLVGRVASGPDAFCGVARFDTNGRLDDSFGSGGQVLLSPSCFYIGLQPDGKLIATAQGFNADLSYAAFMRLNSNGTLDSRFGTGGVVQITDYATPTRVAVTASGNILTGLLFEDPADGLLKSYVAALAPAPPQVTCAAADGAWHGSDAAIACTASAPDSALANAADASFNLTTNVPIGTETANAATNTHQVCNTAGVCTTAGPIAGNKVDKKPTAITITSPASNATYQLNSSVGASYACSDGGSGVATCQGSVANASPIDTSSTGSKTFTVTSIDNVGNPSSLTATYSVVSGGGGGSTSADLGITLSAPSKVSPGGTLTYSIAVANAGKALATGVVVSDAIPAGTVFANASSSQGTVTAPPMGSNGTVTVNVGSLANGATATVSVVVTVTAASGTVLSDTATVTSTTQDLNGVNNSATQSTTVSKK